MSRAFRLVKFASMSGNAAMTAAVSLALRVWTMYCAGRTALRLFVRNSGAPSSADADEGGGNGVNAKAGCTNASSSTAASAKQERVRMTDAAKAGSVWRTGSAAHDGQGQSGAGHTQPADPVQRTSRIQVCSAVVVSSDAPARVRRTWLGGRKGRR